MTRLGCDTISADLARMGTAFILPLRHQLERLGLLDDSMAIDHICYRVDGLSRYEDLKRAFSTCAELLSETLVNGRPIASYRLRSPLSVGDGRTVDVLELPAPKPGAPHAEGFDHIEVVVPMALELFKAQHPGLYFDVKNISSPINADISLKLDGGLVKFHEVPLHDVIASEQRAVASRSRPWVAVIDFDDTLVASRAPFLDAVHEALEAHLGASIDPARVAAAARPTFPEFFASFGIVSDSETAQLVERFTAVWPRHAPGCDVPTGIHSLLSCLRSEGVRVHLWTARDLASTVDFLKLSGFFPLIEAVHAFDPHRSSKPYPTPALRAACSGTPCVALGDSTADQAGAHALGIPFLQAAWIQRADLGLREEAICPTPLIALTRALTILGNHACGSVERGDRSTTPGAKPS